MILVSFFLEDNVLSDEIKLCYIFEYEIKGEASPSILCRLGEWRIVLET